MATPGGSFVCHEDGIEFDDIHELQRHLKSKTAWSNAGLVGCRVSVLLENREWSEGLVAQRGPAREAWLSFGKKRARLIFPRFP